LGRVDNIIPTPTDKSWDPPPFDTPQTGYPLTVQCTTPRGCSAHAPYKQVTPGGDMSHKPITLYPTRLPCSFGRRKTLALYAPSR